jgi:hypothetical protein
MALLCYVEEKTMPEFTTVSVKEAQLRTIPGRQGKFLGEYADYIQQLPQGQAGRLSIGESEKQTTIRRRLVTTAKALGMNMIVKRSGNDLYFWREDGTDEQPKPKRRYTRRNRRGRAGDYFPPQPIIEPELGEHEVPVEESLELDQLAQEAERRVEQS